MMIEKHLKNGLFALFLAFLSVPAPAQNEEGPARISLSLEEAKQYALDHNLTIQNASLDIRKAEAAKWQAISSLLPQVSAKADYSTNFGYRMNLGAMDIALPASITIGITSAVSLTPAQIIGIGISKVSGDMADISLKQTEQQITNNVKTLYCSALVTEETLNLYRKNAASLGELYNYTLKSVEVGAAELTSADQIRVRQSQMENTVSSTERSLEMIYNSLRVLLNISASTEITLTDGIDDLISEEKAFSLLSEDFDMEKNYGFQLLRKSADLSKKQLDLAKWAYAPSLSVFHQYSAKEYLSDEMTMNMTPPNMLGATLNIPIFSSGNRLSAVRSAKHDYDKQINTLVDTEASLEIQYRQLCYNLTSAYESFINQKENLEVTKRVFDNISRKYQYGMASSMEVTTASTDLDNVQGMLVQSILEFITAQTELEQLLNNY